MIPGLLLLLTLFPAVGMAHDLWIDRNGPLHTLDYGHERSRHDGAKRLEYKPETVLQARCVNDAGVDLHAVSGKQYPVTLNGDCAASWFLLSSGYWSKTPYGTKNLPKTEATSVIDSWRSVESIKRIDRWGAALAGPVTRELELTPTDNPLKLKSGEKLRLRAWFQGKLAANVTVAYFGKPRGVSGADGAVNIRLTEPGFQLIEASLELPLNDGKADKTIHTASLQFETQ